jgi:hypothetical protein
MQHQEHAMKFYLRWFGSLILVVAATAWSQSKKPQPPPPADNPELRQLFADDQHDRGSEPFEFDEHGKRLLPAKEWKEAPGAELAKHDAARRARVREMLNAGTVRTARDYTFASFIFQHGATPDDYLLAHVLGMIAASKGYKDGRWIAAATLDRYLQSMKQPQVFGTQFLYGPEGTINQGEYKTELLSNSVRTAMCVRPYEKQQEQLKRAHYKAEELDPATGLNPCP